MTTDDPTTVQQSQRLKLSVIHYYNSNKKY